MAELMGVPPASRQPEGLAGGILVLLLGLRIAAGIAENFGIPHLSEAAALALCAVLALHLLRAGRIARAPALLICGFLLWIAACLISARTVALTDTMEAWSLAALLMLYALLANALWVCLQGRHGLRLAGRLFAIFLTGGAVLAFWQVLSGQGFVDPGKPGVMRAFGSDVHPVSFGLQLVLALAGLVIVRLRLGLRSGVVIRVMIMAALLALYLTYARTAWGLAGLVGFWALVRTGPLPRRMAAVALAVTGAGLLVTQSTRFEDLADLPEFLAGFSFTDPVFDHRMVSNSVSWRIVNWAFGLQQALDAALSGHGPGQSARASLFGLEMHNIILEAFFELGLPGLIAVVVTLAGFARLHASLPGTTPSDRAARAIANAAGLGLLAAALLSSSMVDQLVTVALYLLMLRAAALPVQTSCLPRPVARDNFGCLAITGPEDCHDSHPNPSINRNIGGPARPAAGSGPAQSGYGSGPRLGDVRHRQPIGD